MMVASSGDLEAAHMRILSWGEPAPDFRLPGTTGVDISLSDFRGRKWVLLAHRSFFLIDPQGIIRKKWIIENGPTTVVPSDTLLSGIEEMIGRR